jgi:hypothetical protein
MLFPPTFRFVFHEWIFLRFAERAKFSSEGKSTGETFQLLNLKNEICLKKLVKHEQLFWFQQFVELPST